MVHTHFALSALAVLLVKPQGERVANVASFEEYVRTFKRGYDPSSSEYAMRRDLFEQRAEAVRSHNAKPVRRWTAGLNELTDRTDEELRQLRGWRRTKRHGGSAGDVRAHLLEEKAVRAGAPNETIDWSGLVTTSANSIMDQGACGSCWAVASSTMLQAHYEIHMKGSKTFATQELVNCVSNPDHCGGDGGCKGATVELAMDYVEKHGLQDEAQLPYEGQDGQCPNADKVAGLADMQKLGGGGKGGGASFGFRGWTKLPENKALPLMQALMDGPVGISVGASSWSNYESGVFDGCDKDVVIDHAVLLIGYGGSAGPKSWLSTQANSKWWTIQNSWGNLWGEAGHIRMLRQETPDLEDEHCGVDSDPKLGTACMPYPETTPVCGMCGILYDSVVPHFVADGASLLSLRGTSKTRT